METQKSPVTPPQKQSISPSLRVKKVWGRVPPADQLWQESLRSDEDLPTFGTADGAKEVENELMAMVSSTMAELQKSSRSQRDRQSYQTDTESSKRKFIEKVVMRAIEEGRDLRKSEGDSWQRPVSEVSYRRVETEVPLSHSRDASPQASERVRATPQSETKLTRGTSKRLKEELRISQEKYQKLEEMYSTLLARKTPRDGYKKKYDDLKEKLTKDQRQLSEKTEECRRLTGELQRVHNGDPMKQMIKDLEELKIRVAKTEQDNEIMKSKVMT